MHREAFCQFLRRPTCSNRLRRRVPNQPLSPGTGAWKPGEVVHQQGGLSFNSRNEAPCDRFYLASGRFFRRHGPSWDCRNLLRPRVRNPCGLYFCRSPGSSAWVQTDGSRTKLQSICRCSIHKRSRAIERRGFSWDRTSTRPIVPPRARPYADSMNPWRLISSTNPTTSIERYEAEAFVPQ
jgi:hypothetical protein